MDNQKFVELAKGAVVYYFNCHRKITDGSRLTSKDVLIQYGCACKQLGVELETTSVLQTKGLIEHTNGKFQGRLVSELRLNNIT